MVRLGERPRWKQTLCLECMALDYKGTIMIEGYVIVLLGLTSPLWALPAGLYFSPVLYRSAKQWARSRRETSRRAPYGGLDIAEQNTAKPRWSGWRRRRSLSSVRAAAENHSEPEEESPLLRLPEEIRRQIFSYVVRPAPELTVCYLKGAKRLTAMPTAAWLEANATRRDNGPPWKMLKEYLTKREGAQNAVSDRFCCGNMLALAKTNRRMYREVIPILYEQNVFQFNPVQDLFIPGSMQHFLAFTHSIPDARLDDLRHLRIQVDFDFHFDARNSTYFLRRPGEHRWELLCGTLKRMSSVSTLHVRVGRAAYQTGSLHAGRRRPVSGQSPENRLLSYLIGVHAKRECVVEVPWRPIEEVVGQLPGASFQLTQKEGALTNTVDELMVAPR